MIVSYKNEQFFFKLFFIKRNRGSMKTWSMDLLQKLLERWFFLSNLECSIFVVIDWNKNILYVSYKGGYCFYVIDGIYNLNEDYFFRNFLHFFYQGIYF
jgi:hypothetical protein